MLTHLPEPVRTFLLQTSILERLSAPLCEAVTGQAGAQAMLEQLMDANLFILPLDNQHAWYRYHVLFADLLRKRLQDAAGCRGSRTPSPGQSAGSRRMAWLTWPSNMPLPGKIMDWLPGLIERVAESLLMHGQAVTLLRWLEALPQETILPRPVLVPLKGFCPDPVRPAARSRLAALYPGAGRRWQPG